MTLSGLEGNNLVFLFLGSTVSMALIMSVMTKYMLDLRRLKNEERILEMKHYDAENSRALWSEDRRYYELKIAELAQRLTANEERWRDANNLVVSGTRATKREATPARLSEFLSSFGLKPNDLKIDPKLVFVLTPFGEEEYSTFRRIKEVCGKVGLNAVRGDEEYASGEILQHIVRLTVKARIVIANISTRNANVFYELGIAHALDKPTILVSRSINDMPFDIKTRRIVVYRTDEELENLLLGSLVNTLASEGSGNDDDEKSIRERI